MAFTAFFLIREDVTSERKRDEESWGEEWEDQRGEERKGYGWSSFFLGPKLHKVKGASCSLQRSLGASLCQGSSNSLTFFSPFSSLMPRSWTEGWDAPGSKPSSKRILVLSVCHPHLQSDNWFLGTGSPSWVFSRILSLDLDLSWITKHNTEGEMPYAKHQLFFLMTTSINQWQSSLPHILLFRVDARILVRLYISICVYLCIYGGSQVALAVKNLPANAEDPGDAGLIPGFGRSAGGRHGNRLQYSCLENPTDRGA